MHLTKNTSTSPILASYRHPVLFYTLAIGITWIIWFIAAFISHIETINHTLIVIQSMLLIIGALAPVTVAFIIIFSDTTLTRDFFGKLINFKKIKLFYLLIAGLVFVISLFLAQIVSLLFGCSISQFAFSANFSFSAGAMSSWVLLLLAPIVEEFAWHSYGTDSLRNQLDLFTTCMVFAILWFLWHFPLFFVKGYYHSNLLQMNVIYVINYIVSLFPYTIIANWLYYKTGRAMMIVVIMHFTTDLFAELFATDPASKVIQTVLLSILAAIIIIKNRDFYFTLKYNDSTKDK